MGLCPVSRVSTPHTALPCGSAVSLCPTSRAAPLHASTMGLCPVPGVSVPCPAVLCGLATVLYPVSGAFLPSVLAAALCPISGVSLPRATLHRGSSQRYSASGPCPFICRAMLLWKRRAGASSSPAFTTCPKASNRGNHGGLPLPLHIEACPKCYPTGA